MLLKNIPMPPSSNHIYSTIYQTGRRAKTRDALQFESDFSKWALVNGYKLGVLKNHLQTFNKKNIKLKFERKFYFLKEKIYYKDGKIKKLDVSNYIKMIDDALAKAINIDDCHIFYGSEEKLVDAIQRVEVNISVIQ